MKYFLAIINTTFCLLGVYSISHAEVKINEIAWMGTVDSTYEEWIELYNTEADAVSLKGWKILKTGDVTLFEIKNEVQILGEGYFLICRTTTTLTNPLGGIS